MYIDKLTIHISPLYPELLKPDELRIKMLNTVTKTDYNAAYSTQKQKFLGLKMQFYCPTKYSLGNSR
mgnify:CR=1 FL=1